MSAIEQPPQQQEKGSSGGKIFAFIGCGCFALILLGAGFMGVILFGVAGMMKKSDAYKDTVAIVQKHPEAIDAMGQPIEPGFMVTGSINLNNGEGSADLQIPVKGPKGSGKIHVVATKSSGSQVWIYSTRELKVTGQTEAIPLGP